MKGLAFAVAVAVATLGGCSSKYNTTDIKKSTQMLSRDEVVTIAIPKDGYYGATIYNGSGKDTANAVKAAFARYTDRVEVSEKCSDIDCLTKEASTNTSYFVVPQILHWEDRATEWSMKPDRIEIKLSVYKKSDLSLINSTIINGSSKIATWGGDHPQDLLAQPINEYISLLY